MAHLAKIIGLVTERYLTKSRDESPDKKRAKRFRSEKAAEQAAQEHIKAFPPVIQRAMKYQVLPEERA